MTDYVDLFLVTAQAEQRELKLPAGAAEEGVAVLSAALGRDWINDAARTDNKKFATPMLRDEWHEVGQCFASRSHSSIVDMLELAAYLKKCFAIPGFDAVRQQLREANFEHARLQLATAYRLRSIGIDVRTFEPPSSRGRHSDLLVAKAGRETLIECYVPTWDGPDREYDYQFLFKSLERFLKRPVQIDVRLKRRSTPRDRKRVGRFLDSLPIDAETFSLLDDDALTVTVTPIARHVGSSDDDHLPRACGDAAWIMECGTMWADELPEKHRHNPVQQRGGPQLRVFPHERAQGETVEEAAHDLVERLRRKFTQARTTSDAGRVVVVQYDGLDFRFPRTTKLIESVRQKLCERVDDWNGVLIVTRGWTEKRRMMMYGGWINSPTAPFLDRDWFAKFNAFEAQLDIMRELG